MDLPFLLHGILGLVFCYYASTTQFYPLRCASKGYFVEMSSPFYQRWRKAKTKNAFRDFAISFFLSRIVFCPIFLYHIFSVGGFNKWAVFGGSMFYVLNCAWFIKGIKIYLNYEEGGKKEG